MIVSLIIAFTITAISGAGLWYVFAPTLNIQNFSLWAFGISLAAIFTLSLLILAHDKAIGIASVMAILGSAVLCVGLLLTCIPKIHALESQEDVLKITSNISAIKKVNCDDTLLIAETVHYITEDNKTCLYVQSRENTYKIDLQKNQDAYVNPGDVIEVSIYHEANIKFAHLVKVFNETLPAKREQ